jgi:hypothetical protein
LALPLASKRAAGSKATLATSLRCHSTGLRRHSKVRSNLPSVVSQIDTGTVEAASGELTEPRIEDHTLDRAVVPVERAYHSDSGRHARGPPLLLGIAVSLAFSRWGPRDK